MEVLDSAIRLATDADSIQQIKAYVISAKGEGGITPIRWTPGAAGFRRAGTESVRLVGGNVLVVFSLEFPFQVRPELF
jgi:hypothetical protein